MSEDQDLVGIGTADDTADLSSVPEPVDSAPEPAPFDDVSSGSDWSPPADDPAPAIDPVADAPPIPQDMAADVLPSGDTTTPPPGVDTPDAVTPPPPLPTATDDGLPPALPGDNGADAPGSVSLPLVDDGPVSPGDVGADVLPTGDTTTPPPGADDPNATITAPPLPPPTADGLPPALPDDFGSTGGDDAPTPGMGPDGLPLGDTTTPPPGTYDPNATLGEAPPVPEAGPDGLPPALPGDALDPAYDPTHDPTQIGVDPAVPPAVDTMPAPSTEVHVVDGALVDENGNAVDPVAAGLWHDGTTVYDADGEVVWTGNSVIGAPVDVPDSIADFMATTTATDVPETLPPALPTTPYTSVPEDDALQLVQQLVGPATGDTYGTLLDQLGSLSDGGAISTDEFGAFLVDHAADLGALTIPSGVGAADPAALQQLAAQFGADDASWTGALASAVLGAEDGDFVPGTRIHVTPEGELVNLGPNDPVPTYDTETTAPPAATGDSDPAVPPPIGGTTIPASSDEFQLLNGQLTDLQGNPVTPDAAGLHYDANGNVLDRDGQMVWTPNNPIGAPNDLPADLHAYLAAPTDTATDGPTTTEPTPAPTDASGHVITNPLTEPLDLSQTGSSTQDDGSSRFAIYSEGQNDRLIDEESGHEVTPEQAGLQLVNGDVVDRDGNVVFTTNNPIGAPVPVPESLKAWLAEQGDGTNTTTLPPAVPGTNATGTTDGTTAGEQPTLEQLLARQQTLHQQVEAMAAAQGITLDPELMSGHEQWIAEHEAMLQQHEDSIVSRIGVMMHEQPVHILTSVDGGPPSPVTVTRVESDRVIGERPDERDGVDRLFGARERVQSRGRQVRRRRRWRPAAACDRRRHRDSCGGRGRHRRIPSDPRPSRRCRDRLINAHQSARGKVRRSSDKHRCTDNGPLDARHRLRYQLHCGRDRCGHTYRPRRGRGGRPHTVHRVAGRRQQPRRRPGRGPTGRTRARARRARAQAPARRRDDVVGWARSSGRRRRSARSSRTSTTKRSASAAGVRRTR